MCFWIIRSYEGFKQQDGTFCNPPHAIVSPQTHIYMKILKVLNTQLNGLERILK